MLLGLDTCKSAHQPNTLSVNNDLNISYTNCSSIQNRLAKGEKEAQQFIATPMGSAVGRPSKHVKQHKQKLYPELPFGLTSIDDDFFSNYCFASPLEVLGEGAHAKVLKGHKRSTGEAFALKCVLFKDVVDGELNIARENEILKALSHDHIIKCYDYYEDTESGWIWMVMELMPGGEFFDRIVAKTVYSEIDARSACLVLLDILVYLHDRDIAQ